MYDFQSFCLQTSPESWLRRWVTDWISLVTETFSSIFLFSYWMLLIEFLNSRRRSMSEMPKVTSFLELSSFKFTTCSLDRSARSLGASFFFSTLSTPQRKGGINWCGIHVVFSGFQYFWVSEWDFKNVVHLQCHELSQNDLQNKHTWVGLIPSVDGSLFIASIHLELKAKVAQPLRFLAYGEAR
jgi:hypothetical protein